MRQRRRTNEDGFSLVEIVIVAAAIILVMAMAVPFTQKLTINYRADAAMNQVVRMLRDARHSAISDRRTTTVNFSNAALNGVAPPLIQLQQLPANGGVPVTLVTVGLQSGIQYIVLVGPDTPMQFGNNTPISFTNPANAGGGLPATQFLADGSFGAAINTPVNGTVFLGIQGEPNSARAVTILGATGRIRSYHWDGTQWQE